MSDKDFVLSFSLLPGLDPALCSSSESCPTSLLWWQGCLTKGKSQLQQLRLSMWTKTPPSSEYNQCTLYFTNYTNSFYLSHSVAMDRRPGERCQIALEFNVWSLHIAISLETVKQRVILRLYRISADTFVGPQHNWQVGVGVMEYIFCTA